MPQGLFPQPARLQQLRDQQWVIFALATNSKLEDLDPAVTRPGRFDFGYSMDHPGPEARIRYIEQKCPAANALTADIKTAVRKHAELFPDTKVWFFHIDQFLKGIDFKKDSPGSCLLYTSRCV